MSGRKNEVFSQLCSPGTSAGDYNYHFFEEYKKLYAASFMLSTQVRSRLRR